LQWKERLSLVLHEDLSIKRLRFEDVIKETENDADDPVSQFDLDYSLMVLELAEFFPQLLAALGGEDLPEDVPAKPVTAPPASEPSVSEPSVSEPSVSEPSASEPLVSEQAPVEAVSA
jgi:hypothetical protein